MNFINSFFTPPRDIYIRNFGFQLQISTEHEQRVDITHAENLLNHFSFIFAVILRFQLPRENLRGFTVPDFHFRMRRTRLARKGNREAALSASQFNAVLERASDLTAMRAKVQAAITHGLFAAECTILRPPFPLYGHYEYDTLTGT